MTMKYDNENLCIERLSQALTNSSLSLFLGAGISKDFGLPDWSELIENLCKRSSVSYSRTQKAEDLAVLCKNKLRDKYTSTVKELLYENFQVDKIIDYPLLVAIGAMCTGSKIRGSVSNIVTYNFDDVLEKYFMYYGIIPEIIKEFPYYERKLDIRIIHPHGFLPFNDSNDSEDIALDASTLRIKRDDDTFWNELKTIVKHNTLLFIGLSFNDENLNYLIEKCKTGHPSNMVSDEPLGFYFAKKSDIDDTCPEKEININKIELLKINKIYPIMINDWKKIPYILCNICQKAVKNSHF